MSKKITLATIIIFIITSSILLTSCQFAQIGGNEDYKISNIKIYKDTPAWKLALAVKNENKKKIENIVVKEPQLLNYQDPKYGATLLLWSVGNEKYKSAETLLKCGADPNIATTTYGETPLFLAAGYSWVDYAAKKDAKYVELLLKYGANPNQNYIGGDERDTSTEPGTSPLIESIGCGIEKTKALVEGGADIDYKTPSGGTAAILALRVGGPNVTLEAMEYAYYLIAEKKAKVSEPYPRIDIDGEIDPSVEFYPVDILRDWIPELGSKGYTMKMEIVEEFARQGVNYWDTEIPSERLEQIKNIYPDTWEEYLKKY